MIVDKESFTITDRDSNFDVKNLFYGYLIDEELFHYKGAIPNLDEVLKKYWSNCGVFLGVVKTAENEITIFTDPLAQYPLFFYLEGDKFCVSNDIHSIWQYSNREVNRAAVLDCLTYFSPVGSETLIKGCKVLQAGSVIKIRLSEGKSIFQLEEINKTVSRAPYDFLLKKCVERIRCRALAVLNAGNPLLQLTGGLDSRLTFAAIFSASENDVNKFDVFCLGNGSSQDKLVYNKLVKKYSLQEGIMSLSGGAPKTEDELKLVGSRFNGLKMTSQSNYLGGWESSRVELTGYFSGGLLKSFGSYMANNRFEPFSYAKSISNLPASVFEAVEYRMYRSIFCNTKDDCYDSFNLFYVNNRSTAHFGAQSVVNNRAFKSIDLLYDAELIDLYNVCPYEELEKASGVIIVDMIKELVSEDLAIFPLAGSNIPVYGVYKESKSLNDTCFQNKKLPAQPEDLGLKVYRNSIHDDSSPRLGEYTSYLNRSEFDKLFDCFPELAPLRKVEKDYKRAIEVTALVSVIAFLKSLTNDGTLNLSYG